MTKIKTINFAWLPVVLCLINTGLSAAPVRDELKTELFIEFNRALELQLNNREMQLFNSSFDLNMFVQRTVRDGNSNKQYTTFLEENAHQSAQELGHYILRGLGQEGVFRFLKLERLDALNTMYKSIIRIDFGERGITYWEFYLTANKTGVKIVDWYDHSNGRLMSKTTLDLLSLAAKSIDEIKNRKSSKDLIKKPLRSFVNFLSAYNNRDYKTVIDTYYQLPSHLKTDAYILTSRIEAATYISEKEHKEALADLAQFHANDTRFSLILADHYFNKKEFTKAHTALETFSRKIAGDAGIDVLHANLSFYTHNTHDAIAYCRRALIKDANYEPTYFILLDLLITEEFYDAAILVLKVLQQRFSYAINTEQLRTNVDLRKFTHSHQYRQWEKSQTRQISNTLQ